VFQLPAPHLVQDALRDRGFVVIREALARDVLVLLREQASRLVDEAGTLIERDRGDDQHLRYCVVPGDRIQQALPILSDLYGSAEILDWIQHTTSNPSVTSSPYMRSGLNINCLTRVGQSYPWHVDAVPYTIVMFLTSLSPAAGGALQIRSADGALVAIRPHAGTLVLMDGARCPHAVAKLDQPAVRLTVPMVYPAAHHERPAGLDEFLYGEAALPRR
jgi:hypothetical protein